MVEATNAGESSSKPKKKPMNPDIVIPPKKPKLTKAERRALQEAQRAAKQEQQQGNKGSSKTAKQQSKQQSKQPEAKEDASPALQPSQQQSQGDSNKRTANLFSHLPPYKYPVESSLKLGGSTNNSNSKNSSSTSTASNGIHPYVLALGEQYAKGVIRGGNGRCKAMLRVFQQVIRDYEPPKDCRDVRHHLDHNVLKPAFQYWTQQCRPHSVSMGNAFTFLKIAVMSLDRDPTKVQESKQTLLDTMEEYIQQRITFANTAISEHSSTKIVNGDVILTYANSDVISLLLTEAASNKNIQFTVIVVDSRPLLEGKQLLEKLSKAGIQCSYVLLNALSYVLGEVTKVFLGASALMSDGSILSRVGTACIALMARSKNVPVLVCCETYKISNRVQLESITGNELGNPLHFSSSDDKNINLTLINPLYDLTPSEFVSGIVTEMGILPPTSVAVLLREMNPQDNNGDFTFKANTNMF